jgi:uncharacterized repeat protein (TIGR04076 family)
MSDVPQGGVMYRVILEVSKTHPNCSAGYRVGERITLEHDMIVMEQTDRICPYAMAAILPYLPLLGHETLPDDWINKKSEIQCPDSKSPVLFAVRREPLS